MRALVADASALIAHHRNLIKLPNNPLNAVAAFIRCCFFSRVNKVLHSSFHRWMFLALCFPQQNIYILALGESSDLTWWLCKFSPFSISHHLNRRRPSLQRLHVMRIQLWVAVFPAVNALCQCRPSWTSAWLTRLWIKGSYMVIMFQFNLTLLSHSAMKSLYKSLSVALQHTWNSICPTE